MTPCPLPLRDVGVLRSMVARYGGHQMTFADSDCWLHMWEPDDVYFCRLVVDINQPIEYLACVSVHNPIRCDLIDKKYANPLSLLEVIAWSEERDNISKTPLHRHQTISHYFAGKWGVLTALDLDLTLCATPEQARTILLTCSNLMSDNARYVVHVTADRPPTLSVKLWREDVRKGRYAPTNIQILNITVGPKGRVRQMEIR